MEYQSPFLLVMVQVLCYGRNLYIIAQNVYAVQGLLVVCLGFVWGLSCRQQSYSLPVRKVLISFTFRIDSYRDCDENNILGKATKNASIFCLRFLSDGAANQT